MAITHAPPTNAPGPSTALPWCCPSLYLSTAFIFLPSQNSPFSLHALFPPHLSSLSCPSPPPVHPLPSSPLCGLVSLPRSPPSPLSPVRHPGSPTAVPLFVSGDSHCGLKRRAKAHDYSARLGGRGHAPAPRCPSLPSGHCPPVTAHCPGSRRINQGRETSATGGIFACPRPCGFMWI